MRHRRLHHLENHLPRDRLPRVPPESKCGGRRRGPARSLEPPGRHVGASRFDLRALATANQGATVSTTPQAMSSATARSAIARTALFLGALAVLATGVVHIQQYYGNDYSTVPTIGTLFFLNFVSAVVLAAGLIVPLRRVAGHYAGAIRSLFAVGGIGFAVLSLGALFVSESSSLFGFTENGYRTPIVLGIVAGAAAAVFLLNFLAAAGTSMPRKTPPVGR